MVVTVKKNKEGRDIEREKKKVGGREKRDVFFQKETESPVVG